MTDTPEEFEQLRRMLKLKRHELPPPRFFNEFSGGVIRRLEAEQALAVRTRSWWRRMPVLGSLINVLETNTLVTGSLATAICTMLVGGVVYSEYLDQTPALAASGGGNPLDLANNQTGQGLQAAPSTGAFLPATGTGVLFSSSEPVTSFGSLGTMNLQPVSWIAK